jgi:hypothetical protein
MVEVALNAERAFRGRAPPSCTTPAGACLPREGGNAMIRSQLAMIKRKILKLTPMGFRRHEGVERGHLFMWIRTKGHGAKPEREMGACARPFPFFNAVFHLESRPPGRSLGSTTRRDTGPEWLRHSISRRLPPPLPRAARRRLPRP